MKGLGPGPYFREPAIPGLGGVSVQVARGLVLSRVDETVALRNSEIFHFLRRDG